MRQKRAAGIIHREGRFCQGALILFAVLLGWALLIPNATAAIGYVQGKWTSPSASQSSITATFTSAQTAGDLIVVAVGWGSTTTGISSVTDSKGNTYAAAVGPTVVTGVGSAAIYYAANIASASAGANVVTVTFGAAVSDPDIRIAEYSGIGSTNVLDVTAVANGTGTTSDSGSATTTNANDLIVGSNWQLSTTQAAGTGFTSRQISGYDGDILEDRTVTSTGAYSATATISPSAAWIMQMAAFKGASSGDTSPPTAPTGLQVSGTPTSSQINLQWTASTDNVGVTGYRIERCQGSNCSTFAQIGTSTGTTYSDSGLTASTSYNYRVRATDAAGNLSAYSNTLTAATLANPIGYVQGKSTSPNASPSSIAATFSSAQTAGNFNVVAVGWGSGSTNISSVTDSKGNTYALAVGPTSVSGLGQASIYYAANIAAAAAGTNTVTVTFSAAAPVPDLRIAEYSGINTTSPLDVTAVASGTGTLSDSGSATTTNANDLIVGSNWQGATTQAAGTGFTSRQISGYDGDILEDRTVTSTGAYNATATISPSAAWIMQMAAFKSGGSGGGGGDTTPPSAPTGVGTTVVSSTQINLNWTAATDNVGVTGYSIKRCQGSTCTTLTPSGTATTYSDTGLSPSTTYTYQIRATDAAGNWGNYSTAVSATTSASGGGDTTPPSPPGLLSAAAVSSTQVNLSWSASTDNVGVTGYQVESCAAPGCSSFAPLGSPVTTTAYNATGLTAGGIYNFRVKARDAAGNVSNPSNVLSATTPTASGATSAVRYDYDSLGRLVQTEMPSLSAVQAYTYDPAGNITSSVTAPITSLTVGGLSAQQGGAGSQITIYGSGFSTTAASNTVTIGGAAATVVSATATQLVVTVPAGATTGNISITTGGSTVNSTQPFTVTAAVGAPTITSFSPAVGLAGGTISILGTNFDSTPGRTKVLINGIALRIVSSTSSSITVQLPANAPSGKLTVATTRGHASSSTYLLVAPPGYSTVNASAVVTENSGSGSFALQSGQVGLMLFEGTRGDRFPRVAVQVAGSTNVSVYDPFGRLMTSAGCSATCIKDLADLPLTGTYSIAFTAPTVAGQVLAWVTTAKLDLADLSWSTETAATPAVTPQGFHSFSTGTAQREVEAFSGAQGELIELDILDSAGNTWTVGLMNSSGQMLWTSSPASAPTKPVYTLPALPADGNYFLVFDPGADGLSLSYEAGIVGSGTLAPGSPVSVSGPAYSGTGPWPVARVYFSGQAGQYVPLTIGSTRGFFYDANFYYVSGSQQVCVKLCGSGNEGGVSGNWYGPLPVTGTYVMYLAFLSSVPSSATLTTWASVPLTVNAAAANVPTDLNDENYRVFTFTHAGGPLTYHASPNACIGDWQLHDSAGNVVSSGAALNNPGYLALGSPAAGSYALTMPNGVFSNFWNPGNQTCSVQLTSP